MISFSKKNKFKETIIIFKENNTLRKIFSDYQEKLEYTKIVSYDETIKSMQEIIAILENE